MKINLGGFDFIIDENAGENIAALNLLSIFLDDAAKWRMREMSFPTSANDARCASDEIYYKLKELGVYDEGD